jgi:hypothetical protein
MKVYRRYARMCVVCGFKLNDRNKLYFTQIVVMLMLTTVNNVAPPPILLIDGKEVLRHFYS